MYASENSHGAKGQKNQLISTYMVMDKTPAEVYEQCMGLRRGNIQLTTFKTATKDMTVEFEKASPTFESMGRELLSVMNVFMIATDNRNVAPIQWNWTFELMEQCKLLESTNIFDKLLAPMVCLILSCATKDTVCISATTNLHKAGLLSVNKLA